MSTDKNFLDFYNQAICENDYVMACIHNTLKLCKVEYFNNKTIVVTDLRFKNSATFRIKPENCVVIDKNDLTYFKLSGRIK